MWVEGCWNVSCERVWFANCLQPLYVDSDSLQCGLVNCTINYFSGPNDQVMISLNGAEDYVHDCVIQQQDEHDGGPTECTGILIGPASDPYVTNTQIAAFEIGVAIQGGGVNLLRARLTNVMCACHSSAVYIQPTAAGQNIFQVFFEGCTFERGKHSVEVTPGVYVDTNGGDSDTVSDIIFNNCMSHDWAGPADQCGPRHPRSRRTIC